MEFSWLAWARTRQGLFRRPGDVALTPAQHACAWFFLVMTLLFLLQTLLGGATEHYGAELSNFFGIDLARVIPFNRVAQRLSITELARRINLLSPMQVYQPFSSSLRECYCGLTSTRGTHPASARCGFH
jgi:hypothetical protein